MVSICLANILSIGCLTVRCLSLPLLIQKRARLPQCCRHEKMSAARPSEPRVHSYFTLPDAVSQPRCTSSLSDLHTLIQSPLNLKIIHVSLSSSFPDFKELLPPSNLRWLFLLNLSLKGKKGGGLRWRTRRRKKIWKWKQTTRSPARSHILLYIRWKKAKIQLMNRCHPESTQKQSEVSGKFCLHLHGLLIMFWTNDSDYQLTLGIVF